MAWIHNNHAVPLLASRRQLLRVAGALALGTLIGAGRPRSAEQAQVRMNGRTAAPAGITLFLCGDVMTGRGIDQILPHSCQPRLYESYVSDARDYVALAEETSGAIAKPVEPDYIWGAALAELAQQTPDVRIINLETAVTTSDAYVPKGINYRMHPGNADVLTVAGIDCCALANNHVLDWGTDGLEETLTTLDRAGVMHAGAGADDAAAAAPAIMKLPGKGRVVVFSCGLASSGIGHDWRATARRPGVNLLPDLSVDTVQGFARQVAQFREPGDIVVASMHWGGNWGYEIPPQQREFARRLIDTAGVNVIHGHSSHHVKGIEVYRGRPVIYGCGDFLNDYEGIQGYEQYRDDLGLMYFPRMDPATGRLLDLVMTPTRIRNLRVNRASAEEAAWLAAVLNREGASLGTRILFAGDGHLALQWGRDGEHDPQR